MKPRFGILCGVVWADKVPLPVRHAEAQRQISSFLHWYSETTLPPVQNSPLQTPLEEQRARDGPNVCLSRSEIPNAADAADFSSVYADHSALHGAPFTNLPKSSFTNEETLVILP